MERQTAAVFALAGLSVISLMSHEVFSTYFGFPQPILGPLAFLYVFSFPSALVYSIYTYYHKQVPRDLWKVGFLGLLGLMGALPGLEAAYYGFFGLFAFFGLK